MVSSFGHLYFEFDSSFVIRVSSLAIDRIVFLLAAASRQFCATRAVSIPPGFDPMRLLSPSKQFGAAFLGGQESR
jgi:hypothetical protein